MQRPPQDNPDALTIPLRVFQERGPLTLTQALVAYLHSPEGGGHGWTEIAALLGMKNRQDPYRAHRAAQRHLTEEF